MGTHRLSAEAMTQVEQVGKILEISDREEICVISGTHTNRNIHIKHIKMFVYAKGKIKEWEMWIINKNTRECWKQG